MKESFKQLAAVVFLLKRNGKVLLEKRNSNSHWMPGHWAIPGGRIEQGETMREAVVREVKEELGVNASCDNLVLVHTMHVGPRDKPSILFFVEINIFEGEPYIAEEAHAEDLRWFNAADLPEPMVPHGAYALLAIERGEGYSEYYW